MDCPHPPAIGLFAWEEFLSYAISFGRRCLVPMFPSGGQSKVEGRKKISIMGYKIEPLKLN